MSIVTVIVGRGEVVFSMSSNESSSSQSLRVCEVKKPLKEFTHIPSQILAVKSGNKTGHFDCDHSIWINTTMAASETRFCACGEWETWINFGIHTTSMDFVRRLINSGAIEEDNNINQKNKENKEEMELELEPEPEFV